MGQNTSNSTHHSRDVTEYVTKEFAVLQDSMGNTVFESEVENIEYVEQEKGEPNLFLMSSVFDARQKSFLIHWKNDRPVTKIQADYYKRISRRVPVSYKRARTPEPVSKPPPPPSAPPKIPDSTEGEQE